MPGPTPSRAAWNHAPIRHSPSIDPPPPPPVVDGRRPTATAEQRGQATESPASTAGSATERLFKSAAAMLVVFVFLYVVVRLVFLTRDALSLPYGPKCLVLILLAELATILGWFGWKGLRLYRALPPAFGQISPRKDDEEKKRLLVPYVNDGGLSAPDGDDGTAAKLLGKLRNPRENYNGDSGGWMTDFRNFQNRQDEAAHRITEKAAVRIAAATATSRWAAVDMVSTLILSSKMIADIARIYNRRVSPRQSFRLALEWAVGVAVSGQAGEVGGQVGTSVGDATGSWLSSVLEKSFSKEKIADTIGHWLGIGTGFAFGKLTEGAANAFLALRLGNRAIRDFRALADA